MSCPDFIARSFAMRTAAHLLHLSSTRYAEHVALNEFYDEMLELVDTYAESYMGLEGQITSFPSVTPPKGDALGLLGQYRELIKLELTADQISESAKSILAELEQVTAQTIYKIKNLK